MADQLYNQFADLPELERIRDFILTDIFGKIKQGVADLSKTTFKIDGANSAADLKKVLEELRLKEKELADQSKRLGEMQSQISQLMSTAANGAKSAGDGFKGFSDQLAVNIQRQIQLKDRISDIGAELKKLNEFRKVAKDSAEFNEQVLKLTAEQKDLQTQLSQTNRVINLQAKEVSETSTEYDKASARAEQLKRTLRDLSVAGKEDTIDFTQAKAEFDELDAKIKKADVNVKDFTKNVGNYANSLSGGFDRVAEEISKIKARNEELNSQFQNFTGRKIVTGFGKGNDFSENTTANAAQLNQLTNEYTANEAALNQLIKTQGIAQDSSGKLGFQVNQLEKSYQDMAASGNFSNQFLNEFKSFVAQAKTETEKFNTEYDKIVTRLEQTKAKLQDLAITGKGDTIEFTETKKEFDELDAKIKIANAAVKDFGKNAKRPYEQLALTFSVATQEAKDLAAQYGTMDKRAQSAAKRANELGRELKKIDDTVGNKQVVDNYGTSIDKVGISIKRLIGNFLTLVGVASIGSLFSSSISEFIEMEKHVRQLENTLKNLGVPEAFGRIETAANRLQKEFKFLDNDEILKSFNQLIVYGKLTEKQINDLIPVIIDFSTASGKDLAEATSIIIRALEGNSKGLREYGINMKDAKGTAEAFSLIMKELKPRVDGVAKSFADSSSGGLAAAKQDFKDLKEEIGQGLLPVLNKILTFFNEAIKGAKLFARDFKLYFQGGQAAIDAADAADIAAGVQENLRNTFSKLSTLERGEEIVKVQLALEKQNELLKSLEGGSLAKEGLGSPDRIAKVKSHIDSLNTSLKVLFDLQANAGNGDKILGVGGVDTKAADDAAKKLEELAKRNAQAQFEIEKLRIQRLIKAQEEILNNEKESYETRLLALVSFTEESIKLIDLEAEYEKTTGKKTATEIELINEKKYDKLVALQEDGFERLKAIREKQKKKEQEQALRPRSTPDFGSDVERINDQLKEAHDVEMDLIAQKKAAYQNLYNEVANAIKSIVGGIFDEEKNRIQSQIDKIDELKQKEIDRISASTESEQQKADRIKIIESKAAADKDVLEKKKRQVDSKKAVFEKAFQSFQIIIDGIKTVAAIKAELIKLTARAIGNPFLAPLIPLLASQIPIAIGTSAAQLVALNAVSIPKFKTGKNTEMHQAAKDKYSGPAVVGDGGKKELIIRENGNVEITPDKPTITSVNKNDIILPDAAKAKELIHGKIVPMPLYRDGKNTDLIERTIETSSAEKEKDHNKELKERSVFKIIKASELVKDSFREKSFIKNQERNQPVSLYSLLKLSTLTPGIFAADIFRAVETERKSLMRSYNSNYNVNLSVPDHSEELKQQTTILKRIENKPITMIVIQENMEASAWFYKNFKS